IILFTPFIFWFETATSDIALNWDQFVAGDDPANDTVPPPGCKVKLEPSMLSVCEYGNRDPIRL
ncbi:MAG: hypothetical protein EBU08_16655, partial [Micrococcales bacterium]|nr:hypothetical protein [Micrococcales bacterium]